MILSTRTPRSFFIKILLPGSTLFFLSLYFLNDKLGFSATTPFPKSFGFDRSPGRCPPRAYGNGRWTGPYPPRVDVNVNLDSGSSSSSSDNTASSNRSQQAMAYSGFQGCASSREVDWHLASDNLDQWLTRFPKTQSYKWTVTKQDGCDGLDQDPNPEQMVRDMVRDGGWLLLGDSITEGHFFSLSCVLYPHVIATPTYVPNSYFDRGLPQNLYLNPESPLVKEMYIPDGFDIASTPLVTFRRVDLLFTQDELVALHEKLHPDMRGKNDGGFKLFSDEPVWTLSPKFYLPLFFEHGYSTLVVSTGGHWTTTLFSGYSNENEEVNNDSGVKHGIDGVVDFFDYAMRSWAGEVQSALDEAARRDRGARKRQVLVRAYLPGHDNCHNIMDPWAEIHVPKTASYNWGSIWRYNDIFERIVTDVPEKYPDIHYLGIERPGRLRPDAHATGDCLHIMVGAGVMEGWSHYIWHYISKELGRGRRTRMKN